MPLRPKARQAARKIEAAWVSALTLGHRVLDIFLGGTETAIPTMTYDFVAVLRWYYYRSTAICFSLSLCRGCEVMMIL